jgi:hypothetical protein
VFVSEFDNDCLRNGEAIVPSGKRVRGLITRKKCSHCAGRLERLKRKGFFQLKIMSYFGAFPWKCTACGDIQFHKDRGEHHMPYLGY